MNPASTDLKDKLVSAAVGTFATDIFIGIMPEAPDANITLRDTEGMPPELNYELEQPGIQVLIRGTKGSYLATEIKAKAVYTALHGIANTVIGTTRYLLIAAGHTPAYVGDDKLNRPMFSINFEIQRTSA